MFWSIVRPVHRLSRAESLAFIHGLDRTKLPPLALPCALFAAAFAAGFLSATPARSQACGAPDAFGVVNCESAADGAALAATGAVYVLPARGILNINDGIIVNSAVAGASMTAGLQGAVTVATGSILNAGLAGANTIAGLTATTAVSSGVVINAGGLGAGAQAGAGLATVDIGAGVVVTAGGVGLNATALAGNSTVNVSSGSFVTAAGIGILSLAAAGQSSVTTGDGSFVSAGGIGISVNAGLEAIVTNGARVSAVGFGIQVAGGLEVVVNAGTAGEISVVGTGIDVTGSGNVTIDAAGVIDATAGNGINARSTGGAATQLLITGGVIDANEKGINVTANSGASMTILTNNITAGTDAVVTESSSGSVTVNLNGTIIATDNAVMSTATSSNISVNVENSATLDAGGDVISINTTSGAVRIDQEGKIVSTAGSGINITASGSVDIEIESELTANQSGIIANSTGTIDIILAETADPLTATNGTGVLANSSGGVVSIAQDAAITAGVHGISITQAGPGQSVITQNAEINAGADAINASGVAGSLLVELSKKINAGEDGVDVLAAGNVEVTGLDAILKITAGQDGVKAGSTAGTVTIVNDALLDVGRDGIVVSATGGVDPSTVVSNSAITAPRNAILGTNVNGPLSITTNGTLLAQAGRGIDIANGTSPTLNIVTNATVTSNASDAIRVNLPQSATSITMNAAIIAAASGVVATSNTANIQLNAALQAVTTGITSNAATTSTITVGTAGSIAVASDFAVSTTGGPTLLTNNGTITGFVDLTDSADVFQNNSTQTWFTHTAGLAGSTSNFRGGNDLLNNPGQIVAARSATIVETVNLLGLENFVNGNPGGPTGGLLTLRDAGLDDTLFTSGNFTGVGTSRFAVDSFLGPPGSTSDRLVVGANTAGSTSVIVNNLNPGPGSFNPVGIPVVPVAGTTAAPHFFLESGRIDRGVFFYDLFLRPDSTHVLAGAPDQEAVESPRLVTAVQGVFLDSSGVLSDHLSERRDRSVHGCRLDDVEPRVDCSALWHRSFGVVSKRDVTDQFTLFNKTFEYDVGYAQATWGSVMGIDVANEGVLGSRDVLLGGVFGGYIGSRVAFDAPVSSTLADLEGWTAGAHLAYVAGVFFIDLLGKYDQYNLEYDAQSLIEFGDTDTSRVKVVGGRANTGLRFRVGSSGIIEAIGTATYSETTMSDLAVGGVIFDFDPDKSLRARGGLRASGDFGEIWNWLVSGSLTASYWQEFFAQNDSNIINAGPTLTLTDEFDGGFGEVTGVVSLAQLSGGWSSYTKFDYFFGNGFQSGRVTMGHTLQW